MCTNVAYNKFNKIRNASLNFPIRCNTWNFLCSSINVILKSRFREFVFKKCHRFQEFVWLVSALKTLLLKDP